MGPCWQLISANLHSVGRGTCGRGLIDSLKNNQTGTESMWLSQTSSSTPNDSNRRKLESSVSKSGSKCRTELHCQYKKSHPCFQPADERTESHCKARRQYPTPTGENITTQPTPTESIYLRRRDYAEGVDDPIRILFTDFRNQQRAKPWASTTPKRMSELEALNAVTAFGFPPDHIQNSIH